MIIASINVNCLANETAKAKKPTEISFSEGINKGYFTYKFIGSCDPRICEEFIDKEGVHYGKCMAVILQSKIDSLILLRIETGRLLIPIDTAIQIMIITKETNIPLYPNFKYLVRLYAMCSEIHKYPPTNNTGFTYGDMANPGLIKLAKHIEATYMQNIIGQHAIWAYANQVSIKELSKYGADSTSIELTKKLLNDVNIVTKINSTIVIKDRTDIIKINKTILLIVSGIAILIIVTMTFIALKKTRKKNRRI